MRRCLPGAAAPVLVATTVLVAAGPAAASGQNTGHRIAIARLTGAQEVPGPGDPDGHGIFVGRTSLTRNVLCYVLSARGIATPTQAHMHRAPVGVAGPIVVTLRTPVRGFSSGCIRAVPDEQQTPGNASVTLTVSELRDLVSMPRQFYTNVHNAEFPAGAIRGQLH